MKLLPHHWIIEENADAVAKRALSIILETQTQAIKDHGYFSILMAGGSTPEKVYTLLAKETCDWNSWQIYLGDERCLAIDYSERNSQMLNQKLFELINIPEPNIHMIPAELGAIQGAEQYNQIIAAAPVFDMVLLGMGEDGHTASLFPGHQHDDAYVHPVFNSPKPPSDRVSLSNSALSNNKSLLILITGEGKRHALEKWASGISLPISKVTSRGVSRVILDKAADIS